MNLKTTLVLALVLAVGGIGWLVYALARPMETVYGPWSHRLPPPSERQ